MKDLTLKTGVFDEEYFDTQNRDDKYYNHLLNMSSMKRKKEPLLPVKDDVKEEGAPSVLVIKTPPGKRRRMQTNVCDQNCDEDCDMTEN
ncbi:MAG: hypothetical protein GY714_00020 [Desulfobacterales bacterium]|nr:hypothetical protein [Desulfobacterales bacterium]